MAGILFVLFGMFYWVFTHGSGGTGRGDTLFGLDYGEFGRLQVTWPILLALGLLAYHMTMLAEAGRLARRGLVLSLVAMAMQVVGDVLQYWMVDPDIPAEFESVPSTLGFYLEAWSYLLLAIGLAMRGIAALRTDPRPRWFALPLVTGLLVMPTKIFPLLGFSDGTRTWEIIYTVSRVPLGLSLVLFGAMLWLDATATAGRTSLPATGAGSAARQTG